MRKLDTKITGDNFEKLDTKIAGDRTKNKQKDVHSDVHACMEDTVSITFLLYLTAETVLDTKILTPGYR